MPTPSSPPARAPSWARVLGRRRRCGLDVARLGDGGGGPEPTTERAAVLSLGARQDAMRVMQGPWTPRCYCTVADLLRFIASHFITRVASRCVNTSRSPWRGRQSCAVAVRRVGTPTDTPPRECGRVACARCHSLGIIRTGLAQSKCYHRHAHDVHPHNPTLCGRASHLGVSAALSTQTLPTHTTPDAHTLEAPC